MPADSRWPSAAGGRSRVVVHGQQVFAVANAQDAGLDFDGQLTQALQMLDDHLAFGGSARSRLLSGQVVLADMGHKSRLDQVWRSWIGDDASVWPQRSVIGAALSGGSLVEIIATAFR